MQARASCCVQARYVSMCMGVCVWKGVSVCAVGEGGMERWRAKAELK